MRPTAHEESPIEQTGRIIYLGDVRRRRGARKRSSDSHYLAVAGLAGLAGFLVWLAVVLIIPPERLLTYVAFFLPLWVTLGSAGAIGAYAADWKRGLAPSLRVSARRGALFATTVELNLAFLAAHRWSLPLLGVSVLLAVAVDVASSARAASIFGR